MLGGRGEGGMVGEDGQGGGRTGRREDGEGGGGGGRGGRGSVGEEGGGWEEEGGGWGSVPPSLRLGSERPAAVTFVFDRRFHFFSASCIFSHWLSNFLG